MKNRNSLQYKSLALAFLCGCGSTASASPTNDLCPNAIALTEGVLVTTNTTQATSVGDGAPSCRNDASRGVWFTYTPNFNGVAVVSTCGSDFSTALAVYTGNCGDLTEVACDWNESLFC